MSLPSWVLEFREPKTEIKFINGAYYKYSVGYRYNPQKKRTDKVTGELLGKITQADGFVASSKKAVKDASFRIPVVDVKTFGVFHLFSTLLGDDCAGLAALFPGSVGETLLVAAMMRFAYQDPLKRMPYRHAHDFGSQKWVVGGINAKSVAAALRHVGENRQTLLGWMKGRLPAGNGLRDRFVLFDSTHVASQSENLSVNAAGYGPQGGREPQIRLMYVFSAAMRQPVYYRLVNGNVTDVASMKASVAELDVSDVVLIADKGFYSKGNADALSDAGLHFIMPLRRNSALIDCTPFATPDHKKDLSNHFAYQNRIIWYHTYERDGRTFTTFLDERLKVEEEADYLARIPTHPEKYTESGFRNASGRMGTLTLTAFLPETASAQALYEAYKQRNEIEVMFDAYKNFLDADKTYMHDRYVLEGWLMANFIAMTAYYRLYVKLKSANLLKRYSPKDIVEISKAIYKTKVRDTWVRSEITKKLQALFKSIDIDYLN